MSTRISGAGLGAISDEDLAGTALTGGRAHGRALFAQAKPEDKMRIVAALGGHGEVVAVTGDGVNDPVAGLPMIMRFPR